MEQTSHNRYTLDGIGSRTSIGVLRTLYQTPYRYQSISEISSGMNTSRANVHRVLERLENIGIIRRSLKNNRSLVRIDISSPNALPLFSLFNNESYMHISYRVRNILSMLLSGNKNGSTLILFGSQARSTATDESDIDLLCVHERSSDLKDLKRISRGFLPEHRIEVHGCLMEDLDQPRDLVVLDALLSGISLSNDEVLFEKRSNLEQIDRSYLIKRLGSCRENLKRSREITDEGADYFRRVATVTLGEIGSILFKGRTISKGEIEDMEDMETKITEIDRILSEKGDMIWLK